MKLTNFGAVVLLMGLLGVGTGLYGQPRSAALIRPWADGAGASVAAFWDGLNTNWSVHGSVPMTLDRTTFVQAPFLSSAALNQANPDVLIFSCSAGVLLPITPTEQTAIANFLAGGGKRIIATFVSFYQQSVADHRWLLPYFGLDPNLNLLWTSHEGQAFTMAHR